MPPPVNSAPTGAQTPTSAGPTDPPQSPEQKEMNVLAAQYDADKQGIIQSCFSKRDESNNLLETYITHVRIVEDAQYPYSRPPPNQPESAKKNRILIISVRKSGQVLVHKARQNPNLTFQIGKTWDLKELTSIENDALASTGFIMILGKHHYWNTHSAREKAVFINTIIRIYAKYTDGKVPELINFEGFGTPPGSPHSARSGGTPTQAHNHSAAAAVQIHHSPTIPIQQPRPSSERRPSIGASAQGVHANTRERRPSVGAAHALGSIPQISPDRRPGSAGMIQPMHRPGERSPSMPLPGTQPIPLRAGQTPPQLQKEGGANSIGGIYGNKKLTQSQDSVAIPPKSSSRNQQIRKVESQPRMKMAPSGPPPVTLPGSRSQMNLANIPMAPSKKNGIAAASAAALGAAGATSAAIAAASAASAAKVVGAEPVVDTSAIRQKPAQPPVTKSMLDIEPEPVQQAPKSMITPESPQPPQPQTPPVAIVPAITLNSDENPIQFHSPEYTRAPSNVDLSSSDAPRIVEEQFKETNTKADDESIDPSDSNVLASGIVFQPLNRRSSIQSIKVFARHYEEEEPEPNIEPEDEQEDTHSEAVSNDEQQSEKKSIVKFDAETEHSNKSQISVASDADSLNSTEQARKNELMRSRMTFIAANNASVIEETLEELNWTGRNDVQILEYKISNEIASLETQKLRNIVELDGRLDSLDQSLEYAIKECDRLEAMFAFFSVQLGSFADQISHIEGQGQGLQVQTRNQKVLWTELNDVIHTVTLPSDSLNVLNKYNILSNRDLSVVENLLIDLYGAVKAVRSSKTIDEPASSLGNMRALKEKRHVYEQAAANFMLKVKATVDQRVSTAISAAENQIAPTKGPNSEPVIITIEEGIYKGLVPLSAVILFVKELDELNYFNILRSYENLVKGYYDDTLKAYFAKWTRLIGKINTFAENLFLSKDGFESHSMGGSITSSVISSTSSTTTKLIRSQTLAKIKTHNDKGIDRNNTISSSSSSHINGESGDLSLLMKPSPVKNSIIKAIRNVKSLVIKEQVILIEVYHLSSFSGLRFPEFIKVVPLAQRQIQANSLEEKVYGIDSDRSKAQDLLNLMSGIFSPLHEQIVRFASDVLEKSVMDCPAVVTALDIVLRDLQTTNLDFLNLLYQRLRDRIVAIWNAYIGRQVAKIGQTHISSKKRSGPISAVRVFSLFCQRIEYDLTHEVAGTNVASANELGVRTLVNEGYEKLGKAIINTLQKAKASMAQGDISGGVGLEGKSGGDIDYEDKQKMNYHILMIENMNVFLDGLLTFDRSNTSIHNLRDTASTIYYKEMQLYVEFVLHRPFGKFMDFLENVEQALRKNPDDSPARKPGLGRSALKKILINFDAKELRKSLEVLHKRVEKHFMEESGSGAVPATMAGGSAGSGTAAGSAGSTSAAAASTSRKLVGKVWAETEREFMGIVRRFRPYIERYYSMAGDSGYVCKIDFTDAEISEAFRNAM